MHIEEAFDVASVAGARAIARAHPFATIVTPGLRATHMPCLVDETADGLPILGHVACADPVAERLGRGTVVAGPDGGVGRREMAARVVAFRLDADAWHAEARLSQDKPEGERRRIVARLQTPGPYANADVARAMEVMR